ncbi:MAG TPA: response regulator, partial [Leptospiraceae bacterium]|nr:response regulator [Leptospiraceae bacterium]
MDFLEDTAIVLERRGIKVFSESDGRQAFQALRRSPVDILLIDIDMPALSGFDLLARFRRNSRISSIPCIFLTGQTGSNSILQALRSGIDDYITKPFHSEELADRIETIVRKKKPSVHEESLFV